MQLSSSALIPAVLPQPSAPPAPLRFDLGLRPCRAALGKLHPPEAPSQPTRPLSPCTLSLLCPALCDLMDCSPPGSPVNGISQARILEWVAISFRGFFPTQGLYLHLLHRRLVVYHSCRLSPSSLKSSSLPGPSMPCFFPEISSESSGSPLLSLSQTVLHIYSQGPGAQHPSARRGWPQTVSELRAHPSSQRCVHFPCCSTRTAATLMATGSPGHSPHTPTPRGHTLSAVTDGHSSPGSGGNTLQGPLWSPQLHSQGQAARGQQSHGRSPCSRVPAERCSPVRPTVGSCQLPLRTRAHTHSLQALHRTHACFSSPPGRFLSLHRLAPPSRPKPSTGWCPTQHTGSSLL